MPVKNTHPDGPDAESGVRSSAPEDSEVPVIVVTGFRDSGKTTAVEGIVRELTRRGYRVGTLKHCHYGFGLDQPGKDSWRHRQAGSAGTVLLGPKEFALLGGAPPDRDPRKLAAWLLPDVDLVVVEGIHSLQLPRVEIVEHDGTSRPAHPEGEVLFRLPQLFRLKEILVLCDMLEERYLKPRKTVLNGVATPSGA